jgi:hypothetical protein
MRLQEQEWLLEAIACKQNTTTNFSENVLEDSEQYTQRTVINCANEE